MIGVALVCNKAKFICTWYVAKFEKLELRPDKFRGCGGVVVGEVDS